MIANKTKRIVKIRLHLRYNGLSKNDRKVLENAVARTTRMYNLFKNPTINVLMSRSERE